MFLPSAHLRESQQISREKVGRAKILLDTGPMMEIFRNDNQGKVPATDSLLVSPQSAPQCDGIRRWGLWEVIRS